MFCFSRSTVRILAAPAGETSAVQILSPGGFERFARASLVGGLATVGYNVREGVERLPGSASIVRTDWGIPPACAVVRVSHFSVNYADVTIRWGLYESAIKFVGYPIVPGFDFSGTVEAVGAGVDHQVGDAVFGITFFGAYSSRLLVPASQCRKTPRALSAAEAAATFLEDSENDTDATEPLARALVKALVALRGGVSVQRSKQDDAVTALREVFPAVRVELVEEHVRRAKGDANVAAGTLVQASLDALKRGEETERKGRVITRDAFFDHVLSKDERKKLFDEYHMEREVKEHHPIVHSDGGKRELRKQTRYRDGKVASTTGERFLVEPKESAEFVKATSVSIRVTGGGRTH